MIRDIRRGVAVAAAVAAVVDDRRGAGERVLQILRPALPPLRAVLVGEHHVGGVERIGALDGLRAVAGQVFDAGRLVQFRIAAAGAGIGAGLDLGLGEFAEAARLFAHVVLLLKERIANSEWRMVCSIRYSPFATRRRWFKGNS